MPIFSRLFGSRSAPEQPPETYKGFLIRATPIRESNRFRLSAEIVPEEGGEAETIIRADTFESLEGAVDASIRKAKQVIDERAVTGPAVRMSGSEDR